MVGVVLNQVTSVFDSIASYYLSEARISAMLFEPGHADKLDTLDAALQGMMERY